MQSVAMAVVSRPGFHAIVSHNINADSLHDAGRNVDILHWDYFSKLLQAVNILDLTAEL